MIEWLGQGSEYLIQFGAVCTAIGAVAMWLYNGYKVGVKKPIDKSADILSKRIEHVEATQDRQDKRMEHIEKCLDNDNKAIRGLEATIRDITKSNSLNLKSQMVLLDVQLNKAGDPEIKKKLAASLSEIHDHLLERV